MLEKQVACLGKFQHESKANADKERRNKPFLTSYRCAFCGFWHVGRKVSKSKQEFYRKRAKMVKEKYEETISR